MDKPITEMTDEEILEQLRTLRARREAKASAPKSKSSNGGAKRQRGPRVESLDEGLEDMLEDVDTLPEELEDA